MFTNNREDMLTVIDKHRKAFMKTDVRFVNKFFKLQDMEKIVEFLLQLIKVYQEA